MTTVNTAGIRLRVGSPEPGRAGQRSGTAVSLREVTRAFGATRALDGFSVEIGPGELVALLGPSGCGKTTALRILAGFETADSGAVLLDGEDVQAVAPQRRDVGMVFQSYSLFPNMTARENVAFGLRLRRVGSAERRTRAEELLEMVELSAQADQYPHQLSGGQQQRVALARALAIEPRVLLLDEPLSALDAKVRTQLREQIRALQRRLAISTLFVTHDQDEALSMADRVGVMREGRLEQIASPADLYARPDTPFVAEFVGTMNRIPGRMAVAGRVKVLGHEVSVRSSFCPRPEREVDVLVRPEALAVEPVADGDGIVMSATFRGAHSRLEILLHPEVSIRVDRPTAEVAAIELGSPVRVRLLDQAVLIDRRRDGS